MNPSPQLYRYIDTDDGMGDLLEALERSPRVAVDTEANSLHRYHVCVCLIQLSVNGENFIVDPLAELDLGGLLRLLESRELLLHGADYDLRMMRQSFGFDPHGEVLDTMLAAQLLGLEQIGLAALAEEYLDVTLAKGSQKADWTRRPLSAKLLEYACNDTRYLGRLADCMTAELESLGRMEWWREWSARVVQSAREETPRSGYDEWRIKGAGSLEPRQLCYLRELWHWRDREAAAVDRPPYRVLGNKALLDLAVWAADNPRAPLDEGPRLPRNCVGRRRRRLARALEFADQLPPGEWPDKRRNRRDSQGPRVDAGVLGWLQGECAALAEQLGIAPSVLAPRAALAEVTRYRPRTVTEALDKTSLMRWQAEQLLPIITAMPAPSPQKRRGRNHGA